MILYYDNDIKVGKLNTKYHLVSVIMKASRNGWKLETLACLGPKCCFQWVSQRMLVLLPGGCPLKGKINVFFLWSGKVQNSKPFGYVDCAVLLILSFRVAHYNIMQNTFFTTTMENLLKFAFLVFLVLWEEKYIFFTNYPFQNSKRAHGDDQFSENLYQVMHQFYCCIKLSTSSAGVNFS